MNNLSIETFSAGNLKGQLRIENGKTSLQLEGPDQEPTSFNADAKNVERLALRMYRSAKLIKHKEGNNEQS